MIEIDTGDLYETFVPVVLLPYGSVFTYEHGIGVRLDDGWIVMDENCVTAYTEAEFEGNKTTNSLFSAVRPVPNFMLKLIIRKIND